MTPSSRGGGAGRDGASDSSRGAAIVTGHSRGLGAAIAARLLQRGVAVLGVSRGGNRELAAHSPSSFKGVELDLSDTEALLGWLRRGTLRRWLEGRREAMLVNNAGLLQPIGPLDQQEPAAVARAVAVNVGAALTLSAAFAAATDGIRDRRILHISSGAGSKAYAGWSVYCATKAAVDHHARAVALDRTAGLRICSLAPGIIDTDMQAEIRASTDEKFPDRPRFVEMKHEGKLHSPEETARLVVDFLLADTFGDEPVTDLRARMARQ